MLDTIHVGLSPVKFIAHRGCSGLEKENSASAFVAACNRSYYGVETDVHRTADGQFIIIHDDSTKRVTGDEMIVEETSFDTLRALRLLDTDDVRGRGDLILPTLREYASICHKYGRVSVLELKNHFEPDDVERILAVMREAGQLEHTIFISFDLPNMICLREKLPEHPLQYLTYDVTDEVIAALQAHHLDLDVKYVALTEENIARLHSLGILVNTWTVNDPDVARRLASWGVDFITTNILES